MCSTQVSANTRSGWLFTVKRWRAIIGNKKVCNSIAASGPVQESVATGALAAYV